jgi:signal transduction histidine kinase
VEVHVEVTAGRVDLRIDSGGPPGNGTGMGLLNMAERAGGLGGTCTAGPGGRGWLVQARLPIPTGRTPGR